MLFAKASLLSPHAIIFGCSSTYSQDYMNVEDSMINLLPPSSKLEDVLGS